MWGKCKKVFSSIFQSLVYVAWRIGQREGSQEAGVRRKTIKIDFIQAPTCLNRRMSNRWELG